MTERKSTVSGGGALAQITTAVDRKDGETSDAAGVAVGVAAVNEVTGGTTDGGVGAGAWTELVA
jgi:hypothetical protein